MVIQEHLNAYEVAEDVYLSLKLALGAGEVLTMHLGPHEVLLVADVAFSDHLATTEVEAAIREAERRIRTSFPEVTRIYLEARNL